MFTRLIDFLKHSPHPGDGKDFPMPTDPNVPAAVPPATAGFDQQLLALADAVRELSRSHQTLLDIAARAAAPRPAPTPMPRPEVFVGGDPGDGLRPSAVIDYARLAPVQQIALGLRTLSPQGPRIAPSRPAGANAATSVPHPDAVHAGAD